MLYDCIIIGAGPAGAFCGYQLAKDGYSCLILDKIEKYGEKVCGGWVPNIGLEELRRGGMDVSAFGIESGVRTKSCRTIRGDTEFDHTYKEGIWGFGTTRKYLDQYIGRQAVLAGADLQFGEKVEKIVYEDGIYRVNGFCGRTLVMASGARGYLKQHTDLYEKQSLGVSMQIRAESDLDPYQVTFWYDDEAATDYFWTIPIGKNLWNVGYWMQKSSPDIKNLFRQKWEKYLAPHVSSFEVIIPLKGAFLGNVCLTSHMDIPAIGAGDFDGTNNLETGEGISFALRSAGKAAEAVRRQLYDQNYERIETIEENGVCAAFLCDRLEFFKISPEEKEAIRDLRQGIRPSEIKSVHKIPEKRWDFLMDKFKKKEVSLDKDVRTTSVRLTFNVSNCCNMSCRYCYANGGNYLSREKLMNTEVARKALELFHGQYKKISSIKFIGGEPALNLDVVEYICRYEQKLTDEGVQEKLPEFIFVTNGTMVDRRLIDLAMNYHMKIGFSYDAPDFVNDQVRVMNNGEGSSSVVRENIRKLKEATNGREPYSVNAVYTRVEEAEGISVSDIVHFIYEELGIASAHVIPVDPKEGSDYELTSNQSFVDAADRLLKEWRESGEQKFFNNLNGIVKKLEKRRISPDYICDAGFGLFSIACDGRIYPCHLFTDQEDFCLGTVEENIFEKERFMTMSETWKNFNRLKKAPCDTCFANRLCIGCLGANYFRTGNQYTPSPFICDMFRKVVRRVILEYVIQEKDNL